MIWLTLSREATASPSCILVGFRGLSLLRSTSFQHAVTSRDGPLIASGTSFAADSKALKTALFTVKMLTQL
jgi:hypothetical protein